jgi:hypothetical protein
MSFPHDAYGTSTETDSGWLQQPQLSGKIHSAKQIYFFQRSILGAPTRIEHTAQRVRGLIRSRAPHADLKMVTGLLVSQ